ncbi:hypothetical protein IP88_02135 [alpha proteobacterium AAP81b]|nr:hypothetical protein IP88_02135 [alpha proteobacterium AAP81b]
MPELSEHHLGYDAAQLGFPSIAACRAIVLQTPTGLFGVHVASAHTNAAARAAEFAQFVTNHTPTAPAAATYLFVVAYTEKPITGYDEGRMLTQWKAEAKAFADALVGFTGRRMGYSLSPANGAMSSYVRYTHNVGMATIETAAWDDHAAYLVRGSHTPTANWTWRGQQVPRNIITAVNIPGGSLKRVNPQSLD